jgi:serine/threonine protein kinase
MSNAPGTRFGAYDVLALIGAGGMGEVYRARDTRLDRIVAIKVLPARLAKDSLFRDRFDREARAISSLDHPHICALYDVGEQQGTSYLVMQYLEGETLADRLKKGALPLDQALQFAIQIADALATAHKAGIVHRDLKPGNIMLTRSGAKLLDFGLAKTGAPLGAGAGLSTLPTTPPNLTAQGTILGTLQYMAPEQLEGKEADARTDIFAFGAFVYEMITGRKAFEGKSQASLIGAILEREPPPLSTLQPLTPPMLDRVVKKCLAKTPEERWQSAKDLHDELRWVAEGAMAPTAVTRTPNGRARKRLAWIVPALLVVLVASAFEVAYVRTPPPLPEMRTEINTPPTTDPISFAISPDGRRLVFVASSDGRPRLWVRALDSTTAQPLAGTEGAVYPFWSPDSRSVGFFAEGKLKRLDIGTGPPQSLANASLGCGGTWSANGVILFNATAGGGLLRVPASGGETVAVTKLASGQLNHFFPNFLPGSQQFLFWAMGTTETTGYISGRSTLRNRNA